MTTKETIDASLSDELVEELEGLLINTLFEMNESQLQRFLNDDPVHELSIGHDEYKPITLVIRQKAEYKEFVRWFGGCDSIKVDPLVVKVRNGLAERFDGETGKFYFPSYDLYVKDLHEKPQKEYYERRKKERFKEVYYSQLAPEVKSGSTINLELKKRLELVQLTDYEEFKRNGEEALKKLQETISFLAGKDPKELKKNRGRSRENQKRTGIFKPDFH